MKRFSFKPVIKLVLLSVVSLSLVGCSGTLEQQAQTVRISPISEEYKLTERLEGKTYILLAETSTGQEQHRYAVSDSLARVLKESGKGSNNKKGISSFVNLAFLGFNGMSKMEGISSEGLEVLSFTDLTNKLNEKDLCQRHADMKEFYQQNGMFRKSDLEFLAKEIGADYLVLPCLLDIQRWSKGRFSVGGVKFLSTHIVSGMLGMEIWDARTGRKVFSATSDVTLASEKIKEEPMSMEEAFQKAWYGIMKEIPKQSPVNPVNTAGIDNEDSGSLDEDKRADSRNLTNVGGTKAG
ncbi:MAG: hypothetical protein JSV60_05215 [Desulfobacterales bacterium]|nr:MAG: hypothetical protein JSV60_05215 [Desulfobacterales bacterium]